MGVDVGRLETRPVSHGADDGCAANLNRTRVDFPSGPAGRCAVQGISYFSIHSVRGDPDIKGGLEKTAIDTEFCVTDKAVEGVAV
ncbi:MAG: hypothetical protein OSB69_16435, partial [Alphaproteobacteria bacterium]|nr:hypothetical protein [Alphaproteobacteria bacterium]